jgi:hypothetical protein
MKEEKLEIVRGSGNVFRDLGQENADVEQFKAILAAEIIKQASCIAVSHFVILAPCDKRLIESEGKFHLHLHGHGLVPYTRRFKTP